MVNLGAESGKPRAKALRSLLPVRPRLRGSHFANGICAATDSMTMVSILFSIW